MSKTRLIFGGIIACVLLALYVYLVWCAVFVVISKNPDVTISDFTSLMSSTMTLIGGLISALVIAELSITVPGKEILNRAIQQFDSPVKKNFIRVVVYCYLAIWIITGITTLLVSFKNPDTLQPLTDIGQTWLGLAVAAAYVYFEINPEK